MKKFYVLGDSFMDPKPTQEIIGFDYRWFINLKKLFPYYLHENLSLCGAGSHHTMNVFLELILKEQIHKNDIIVMHLSAIMRTFDRYLDDDTQGELRQLYLNTMENNIFFISYLYMMSQKIKFRLILFAENILKRDLEYFRSLNNEFFHLSEYNLFEVEHNELKNEYREGDYEYVEDLRFNHMSKDNHMRFSQYIVDVLEGEDVITKFRENFKRPEQIYKPYKSEIDSDFKTKFIYE